MTFKKIAGYEGYEVSKDGLVFSTKTGKYLKPNLTKCGYHTVSINKKPGAKFDTVKVHRLVAKTHITNPNPRKFDIVNHKDGNKTNNKASNLEWIDQKGNARHAVDVLAPKRKAEKINSNGDVMSLLKSVIDKVSPEEFYKIFKAMA